MIEVEKNDIHDFQTIWNAFILFENVMREKGEEMDAFSSRWLTGMGLAQSAGCNYSDALLSCKFLQKANLDEADIKSIVNSIAYYKTEMLGSLLSTLNQFYCEKSESAKEVFEHAIETENCEPTEEEIQQEQHANVSMSSDSSKGDLLLDIEIKDEIIEEASPIHSSELINAQENHLQNFKNSNEDLHRSSEDGAKIEENVNEVPNNPEKDEAQIKSKANYIGSTIQEKYIKECEICGSKLSGKSIRRHVRTCKLRNELGILFIPKERKIAKAKTIEQCDLCGKRLKPRSLKVHKCRVKTKENNEPSRKRMLPCELCGKSVLYKGMKKHHDLCLTRSQEEGWSERQKRKKIGCQLCGLVMFPGSLNRHLQKCITQYQGDKPVDIVDLKGNGEKVQCEYCAQELPSSGRLKLHYGTCPNLDPDPENQTPFKNRKVTCRVCQKIVRQRYFRLHFSLHTHNNTYKCDSCSSTFPNSLYLYLHKNKIHKGRTKLYNCSLCSKSFNATSGRDRHYMKVHTNERPFQCLICGYSTVDKAQLNRHSRSHTGKKPFKCSVCDKAMASRRNVERHLKTAHPQADGKVVESALQELK